MLRTQVDVNLILWNNFIYIYTHTYLNGVQNYKYQEKDISYNHYEYIFFLKGLWIIF